MFFRDGVIMHVGQRHYHRAIVSDIFSHYVIISCQTKTEKRIKLIELREDTVSINAPVAATELDNKKFKKYE